MTKKETLKLLNSLSAEIDAMTPLEVLNKAKEANVLQYFCPDIDSSFSLPSNNFEVTISSVDIHNINVSKIENWNVSIFDFISNGNEPYYNDICLEVA